MTRITRFPVERRRSAPVPLVPLAPQRGRIPDDIDHLLSDLARSEEADSPVIRNALATAYSPILLRIDRKVWWAIARHDLIDLDDVTHEGFLVFCDLLQRWSGDGSFSRFLLGRYQWRVRERVVRLNGRAPSADVAVSWRSPLMTPGRRSRPCRFCTNWSRHSPISTALWSSPESSIDGRCARSPPDSVFPHQRRKPDGRRCVMISTEIFSCCSTTTFDSISMLTLTTAHADLRVQPGHLRC